MKKVVFANDYSSCKHIGSQLLNSNLKKLIVEAASLSEVILHNRLTARSSFRKVTKCDVLIINGEGNFHGGNPDKLHRIMRLATFAHSQGKRVALINSVAANLPDNLGLNVFDFISIRETASLRAIRSAGYQGELSCVPDASLLYEHSDNTKRSDQVIVTDCVNATTTLQLNRACSRLRDQGMRVQFIPFQYQFWKRQSYQQVLHQFAQARIVLSGRFHACCFAVATSTPVISVDSNNHKTRAMMQDFGLSDYHFIDVEHAVQYLVNNGVHRAESLFRSCSKVDNEGVRNNITSSLRRAIGI